MQIVPNLCSYGPKSCNFKVFICKYLFHAKNPKNEKKENIIAKKSVFAIKSCIAKALEKRMTFTRDSVETDDP